jgi:hypothetical protein
LCIPLLLHKEFKKQLASQSQPEMGELCRIVVGGQCFSFPASQIEYLENWEALPRALVDGAPVPFVQRDPQVFGYIQRWLCGYPAHLPATEWETVCLLADCENVYGAMRLRLQLLEHLCEQDSSLGRKARLLLERKGGVPAFVTDTWRNLAEPALAETVPLVQRLLSELAVTLEHSADAPQLAPLAKFAAQHASLCRSVLEHLLRRYAVSTNEILLLNWLVMSIFSRKAKPEAASEDSMPDLESSSDVENPRSPRHIPPPRANLSTLLSSLQGEDGKGVRVFPGE